jgi:hypothetical protein
MNPELPRGAHTCESTRQLKRMTAFLWVTMLWAKEEEWRHAQPPRPPWPLGRLQTR